MNGVNVSLHLRIFVVGLIVTAESPRDPDDVTIQFGRRLLGTKRR